MWFSFKPEQPIQSVEESKVSRTLVVERACGDGGSLFIKTALKESPELKIVAVVDSDK